MTPSPAPGSAPFASFPDGRRLRRRFSGWEVAVAAVLLVLSLGLPWGQSLSWRSDYHAGWMSPMLCRTVQTWDGWYETQCDPGFVSAGWISSEAQSQVRHGAAHEARFGLVAGLVLLALGWRLHRRRYLWAAAAVVAVVTVLTSGLGIGHAGTSAAWLAVVVLAASAGRFVARLRPHPKPAANG